MTDDTLVPEADIEGFIDWVRTSYSDDRWSRVYDRNRHVVVWSGKHPTSGRLQKDLRPKLHEHGLTISRVQSDVPQTVDGEMERVTWIDAIPIAQAIAKHEGMQCHRSACHNVIAEAGAEYCPDCQPRMSG